MRILLTVPSLAPEFGGPTAVAHSLAHAFRAQGHDVTVVGVGESAGPGVVGLRPLGRFHGTPMTAALHRLPRLVRSADVVHVLGFRDPVGTGAVLAARLYGVPYVLEPVGMHRQRLRSLRLKAWFDSTIGRPLVNGASRVIASSSLESEELTQDGVARGQIAVRPNGLDLAQYEPLPAPGRFRAALGLCAETPLVLALGRIARKKGLLPLLRAVAGLPRAHLVIAGPDDRDGTLPELLEARARLSLEGRVRILADGLWGRAKVEALGDADLFCLPSMTENFGIAAAEAAACGTAVVVSDRCGVVEWLLDGVEVVPYGNAAALASTLSRLLAEPAERARLAAAGRSAARRLGWDRIAGDQLEMYARILDRGRGPTVTSVLAEPVHP